MRLVAIAVTVLLLAVPSFSQTKLAKSGSEEIAFVNGNVYTGTGERVEAFLVRDGKIAQVGTTDTIRKGAGKAQLIDLQGKFVMPGFNDAHLHLANGGFEKLNVNLIGVNSLDEMKERVADRVKTAAAGEWILGRGWDHTTWAGQKLPTRQDIDAVT